MLTDKDFYTIQKQLSGQYSRYFTSERDQFLLESILSDSINVEKNKSDIFYSILNLTRDHLDNPLYCDTILESFFTDSNVLTQSEILYEMYTLAKDIVCVVDHPIAPTTATESNIRREENTSFEAIIEAYDPKSAKFQKATNKAYSTYKKVSAAPDKFDAQVTKMVDGVVKNIKAGVQKEIIEGKQFSIKKTLNKCILMAAAWSANPAIAILGAIVYRKASKKLRYNEKQKLISELEGELEIVIEKIDDARNGSSPKDRKAKYELMRIKIELEKTIKRLKMNTAADEKSLKNVSSRRSEE